MQPHQAQERCGPVFVIGAGPSGLTAAYRLRQQGIRTVILERRDRIGGMLYTHREAGYLLEQGATILPSAYTPVVKLAMEIGCGPDLMPAGSIIGFARGSTIHNLRSDHLFQDVPKTPLVSLRSKVAMARFGIDATRGMTEWAERLIDEDDDTIRGEIPGAMGEIVPGLGDTVDYTRISRWPEVIVYSRPGLYKDLGRFQVRQRARKASRIALAGVFRSSSNICTATVSGEHAAADLVALLNPVHPGAGGESVKSIHR